MGRILDQIFNGAYYQAVCKDFDDANTKYQRGFAEFKRKQGSMVPLNDYEYEKYVHEHIGEIKNYEKTISAATALERSCPSGVKEFRSRNHILENTFETKEQLVAHQEEIREYDSIILKYDSLFKRHEYAIRLKFGWSPTYDQKKYVVENTEVFFEIGRLIDRYEYYRDRYPHATAAIINGSVTVEKLNELNEKVSEADLNIMEEYIAVRRTYSSVAFQGLVGTISAPAQNDYSPAGIATMKKIIQLHADYLKLREEEKKINEAIESYPGPITLRFGKIPSSLTQDEKRKLLTVIDELKKVQSDYFETPDIYWFNWSGNAYTYPEFLVKRAGEGKIIELPKDPNDLLLAASFYKFIEDLPDKAISLLLPESPSVSDVSPEAIAFRKSHLGYFQSSYGKKHGTFEFKNTTSRDDTLRELFNFSGYGEGKKVHFAEDFSIPQCFDLQLSIEGYGTTFGDCYDYVVKNYDALIEYNKRRTGKATWYIDDLLKIARKDKDLFAFIDDKNREKELRESVRGIIRSYPLGFAEYKKSGLSGFDVDTASISQIRAVINDRQSIERSHVIEKAKQMLSSYADAVSEKFGSVSQYSLTYDTAKSICDSEYSLRIAQTRFDNEKAFRQRIRNATSDWEMIAGFPLYFFYWYYPKRFDSISEDSHRARSLVYSFKDGISHGRVAEMVQTKLRSTFSESDLHSFTFVCIPASTTSVNEARYRSFSEDVCNALGMRNGFPYVHITREKTPSRLGGTDSAEYSFDSSFFDGARIILFDDIVTRGGSMRQFRSYLENCGATIVCGLSIGRTYSDYYGDNRKPHPWTGNI